MRIALSKVSTIASNSVENSIRYILAQSKFRGHTARSRRYEVRLPKEEKENFKRLARAYKLSEKETFRLIVFHVQKGITTGKIKHFDNSRKLTQQECLDAWCREVSPHSGKLNALTKGRQDSTELSKQRQLEVAQLRDRKIKELEDTGTFILKESDGKTINLKAIDQLIEQDAVKQESTSWNEYLKSLESNQSRTDKEYRIERLMFRCKRVGFDISYQDALEYIETEDLRNEGESELIEEITYVTPEEEAKYQAELEQDIEKELGIKLSDLPAKQVKSLKLACERDRNMKRREAWKNTIHQWNSKGIKSIDELKTNTDNFWRIKEYQIDKFFRNLDQEDDSSSKP